MTISIYKQEELESWNKFLEGSGNSTFLFNRNFLDYHSERFNDYSLIAKNSDGKILALLPANITQEGKVYSHQGLTYGSVILPAKSKLNNYIEVLYHFLKFLAANDIKTLELKLLPDFYQEIPSDEIEYLMFVLNAELFRCDIAYVLDQQNRIPYSGNIRREANKAEKLNVKIVEDDTLEEFWQTILSPNLQNRFGVQPVHSLEEISLLKQRFPENIKQFNAYVDDTLMAGTTMFLTDNVAHCQYISSTEDGRKNGVLNYLFKTLMDSNLSSRRYFDFGIVNENQGRSVNNGMLFWKESFGGRAKKHNFYRVSTDNYSILSTFIQ